MDRVSEPKQTNAAANSSLPSKPSKQPSTQMRRARSGARALVATAASVVILGGVSGGCLSRPVTSQAPTTKDNFTTNLRQSAIDKVDLLFDIDNSASMGDKQAYLSAAVPDLISRLLAPYCVDAKGNTVNGSDNKPQTSDPDGVCADATLKAEFKPVHDMHIGVVTSSLGTRGGDVCDPTAESKPDDDNKGELFNRGVKAAGPIAVMQPSNFLYWFPSVAANTGKTPTGGATPITDVTNGATTLEGDFADLITGVAQGGCGIESQLESWYRFLVQPDPYDSIDTSSDKAVWSGVDKTIIQQRHDFLRPDSLVAIITLTDENDSEIDGRSVSGTGWKFIRSDSSKFAPPHGTSQCATNPADPGCTSCGFGTAASDPACTANGGVYNAANDWGFDPNLRHVHTKAKYGVDPQYPISRYVKGLTQTKIPDRNGEYPSGAGSYVGNANCTNPLFASSLPDSTASDTDLCNLTVGFQRTPDLVFYGIIGGVPYQLLHYDGTPASLTLSPADWTKILGNDPENYDYTGIDPHMVESYTARTPGSIGVPGTTAALTPGETAIQPPTASNTADPWNGREWITDTPGAQGKTMPFAVDRQYACTFPIPARHCAGATGAAALACDCPTTDPGAAIPQGGIPPVCDATTVTDQTSAKVYPTPRELLLAHKLGAQGIASSLCPIDVAEKTPGDPLYGYRPAVAAIVERLKNALASQCLPQALTADANGDVPCLILEALPPGKSCSDAGLQPADPKAAASYQAQLAAQAGTGDAGTSTTFTICQVPQLVGADLTNGSCVDNNDKAGWCYLEGSAAGGGCAQAIKFSAKGNPAGGARVALQCIQQTGGGSDGGTATSSGDGG